MLRVGVHATLRCWENRRSWAAGVAIWQRDAIVHGQIQIHHTPSQTTLTFLQRRVTCLGRRISERIASPADDSRMSRRQPLARSGTTWRLRYVYARTIFGYAADRHGLSNKTDQQPTTRSARMFTGQQPLLGPVPKLIKNLPACTLRWLLLRWTHAQRGASVSTCSF